MKSNKFTWFIVVSLYRTGKTPGLPVVLFDMYQKVNTTGVQASPYCVENLSQAISSVKNQEQQEGIAFMYILESIATVPLTGTQAEKLALRMVNAKIKEIIKANK